MQVQFVKMSPTQNMTILVESAVSRDRQPAVAAALMAYDSVYAEQAGFVETPQNPAARARLQMAGGEFCGNATMSLAALIAWDGGMKPGERGEIPLEVSGMDGILPCGVEMCGDFVRATVQMPSPLRIARHSVAALGREIPVAAVGFSGITHIVVPIGAVAGDWTGFAEQLVDEPPAWVEDDAMGVMLYREGESRIDPLVCVRAAGTTVWERGCGSGTAALGAWLAHRERRAVRAEIRQPGGVITVDAQWSGERVEGISITGEVRLAARGTAYCHCTF